MRTEQIPVLIVGGGGCGLAASILLSELGIPSLLVERHPTPGRMPKARYINQRTMEIFRQFGLDDTVYSQSMPLENMSEISWRTSLGGKGEFDQRTLFRLDAFGGGLLTDYAKDSPCRSTVYPQVRLEPMLHGEAAARAPGQVRYNHELVSLQQDADCVRAVVDDRDTGERFEVEAQYVIGADGGKTVGPSLGVTMAGLTDMAETVTVYFKADLSQYWHDDTSMTTWFVNPEGGSWSSGVLGQLGPHSWGRHSPEWMFHFNFRPDDPARFDELSLLPRMRDLLKISDLQAEIIAIGHWTVEGVLADRYRSGRVFLAGDAAHRHPPTTGLGLNSAVQDAHNLAWKLNAVLRGWADGRLLDSYEAERRPVGARNVNWALMTYQNHAFTDMAFGVVRGDGAASNRNFAALFAETPEGRTRRARVAQVMGLHRMEFQAHDLEIGFSYADGALCMEDSPAPQPNPMGITYVPTTRPGHRLPHAWLDRDGRKVSTLDLVSRDGFVLLLGSEGRNWRSAAAAARWSGPPLSVLSVGPGCDLSDPDGEWSALREAGEAGAILVRPDAHVAWRSAAEAPDMAVVLGHALACASGRDRPTQDCSDVYGVGQSGNVRRA